MPKQLGPAALAGAAGAGIEYFVQHLDSTSEGSKASSRCPEAETRRHQSKSRRYIVGRLRRTRLVLFEGERTGNGTPTWIVMLQADAPPHDDVKPKFSSPSQPYATQRSTPYSTPKRSAGGRGLPDDRIDNLFQEAAR